jgi:hypothetical protein
MEDYLKKFIQQSKTGYEGEDTISIEELILKKFIEQEALVNVLVEKGLKKTSQGRRLILGSYGRT